jgi:hypothetical protein
MKTSVSLLAFLALASTVVQSQVNPAMNTPDEVAWKLFIQVNKAAGKAKDAAFETWASDTDTFQANPRFPPGVTLIAPHLPALFIAARLASEQQIGGFHRVIPPNPGGGEESRRNRPAFEFIVKHDLYKVSGLKAAFGTDISFPIDAIEVKANWKPVSEIPSFTNNKIRLADVPKLYHVSKGSDHKEYALISLHIISKLVPNWTWATFEHSLNPGRCDVLGCIDRFGAQMQVVYPNAAQPDQIYPPCVKSAALKRLIASAKWDNAFANYCLKGTQTDFTDVTGRATRLGNSFTEKLVPVDHSSCMTCHAKASFNENGQDPYGFGLEDGFGPLGPINWSWFWRTDNKPPIYPGMGGLDRIATSSDFVWSIPLCAYDDTVNPPRASSSCTGK